MFSPWDHTTHTAAVERVELEKTWTSFQILTGEIGWSGERVPAPASAGLLARAVFGVHELPPALARVLDHPLRVVFPSEIGPLATALRHVDLGALREGVDDDTLDTHQQQSLESYVVDDALLERLRSFYDRAEAARHVVVSSLS